MKQKVNQPAFWKNQSEAVEIKKRLTQLEEEVSSFHSLEKQLEDLKSFSELAQNDEQLGEEISQLFKKLQQAIKQEEIKTLFTGPFDQGNAMINIEAGAGGREAEDWVAMLLRMYERYAERQGWKTKILSKSLGEPGGPDGRVGINSIAFEMKGKYVYGSLKKESGVHRLVRISPFSEQGLRHTSFALVEVLPELKTKEIEINPSDLRVDTFRSSGPGGQYVNRRESAIRLTHLPTGLVVSCQSERLQGLNRAMAMKVLAAKLQARKEREQKKELANFGSQGKDASWGQQIRSYILQPYQLARDDRTGVKISNVMDVLDGNLQLFIEAEIKQDDN